MILVKNKEQVLHVLAEDISINEQASNDIFLLVDFLMFTSEVNLNNEGVTVAFINDFLSHTEDYMALPLYCDTEALLSGRFSKLGHRYSRETGSFDTTQVGGFTKFWSKEENGVVSVYGQARIPKREYDICERIIQLYELGKLSMSFEVKYIKADTIQKDGATLIDVGESNKLTGACICWQPAFPDAQAQLLVAEEQDTDESELVVAENVTEDHDADTEVSNEMPNENLEALAEDQNTVEETVVAEEQAVEAVAESAEETVVAEEERTEVAEAEEAIAEDAKEDNKEEETMIEECGGKDKEDAVAETQEANAEVIEESLNVYESVHECPETGETIHVTEECHRLVETIAERDQTIAELKTRIAELEEIKGKYDTIIAEREAAELATKKAQAKAFAEKQGLDITVAEVETAIDNLDYKTIVEMSIAQDQNEEESADEPVAPAVTLASFVDLEVSDENEYGGLLKPAKK